MGACATKLKILKGVDDSAPAPEPAPETVKEGLVVNEEGATHEKAGKEEKVKEEGGDGESAAVKVDDMGNKPRSLSNLFKETEHEQESSGNVETTQTVVVPSEPVQQEEVIGLPEAEETVTMPLADVESTILVATSETVMKEIPVIAAATDVQKEEKTENEEKRTEEKEVVVKDVVVTEKAANDDNRQEEPALPVSSEHEVAEEVTISK